VGPRAWLTSVGNKNILSVPGGRTAHCPGRNLVRRVSVCMGRGDEHGTCSRHAVKRNSSLVDQLVACRVFTQPAFTRNYEPMVNDSGKWSNMVQGVPG
jgi:hypothetical protein